MKKNFISFWCYKNFNKKIQVNVKICFTVVKVFFFFVFLIVILLTNHNFFPFQAHKIKSNSHHPVIYQEDFNVKKPSNKNNSDLYWAKVSIHEAGHILFGLIYPKALDFKRAWIDMKRVRHIADGVTEVDTNEKRDPVFKGNYLKIAENFEIFYKELLLSVGGHAAEMLFFGKDDKWKWNNNPTPFKPRYTTADQMAGIVIMTKLWRINNKSIIERKLPTFADVIKEAKEIMSNPQHIKTVLLLAQAIFVLEEVNKEDALWIYKNHQLPSKVKNQQKRNAIWQKLQQNMFLPFITQKVVKSNEMEMLFQTLKQKLFNFALFHDIKLKINERSYLFWYLFEERNKKSIGNLSTKAIKELNVLLKNLITFEDIKVILDEIIHNKKNQLLQEFKKPGMQKNILDKMQKLGVDKLFLKNKNYSFLALKKVIFNKINIVSDIKDANAQLEFLALTKNNISILEILNALQTTINDLNKLISNLQTDFFQNFILDEMINFDISAIIINNKKYSVNALRQFDFKIINNFSDLPKKDNNLRRELVAFVQDKIDIGKIFTNMETAKRKSLFQGFQKTENKKTILESMVRLKIYWLLFDGFYYSVNALKTFDFMNVNKFNNIKNSDVKLEISSLALGGITMQKIKNIVNEMILFARSKG